MSIYNIFLSYIVLNSILILHAQNIDKNGIVFGTIIDSETQERIYDSSIYLAGTNQGCVSDSNGYYRLSNIKPGNYKIIFTRVGFLKKELDINLEPNERKELNILLDEYGKQYEDTARIELSKGIIEIWMTGLIVESKNDINIPAYKLEEINKKYVLPKIIYKGCGFIGAEYHNRIVDEYLEKMNGKNWIENRDKELNQLIKMYNK